MTNAAAAVSGRRCMVTIVCYLVTASTARRVLHQCRRPDCRSRSRHRRRLMHLIISCTATDPISLMYFCRSSRVISGVLLVLSFPEAELHSTPPPLCPPFKVRETSVSKCHLTLSRKQLQICYDMRAAILYVTVIKAKNLRYVNDSPPDPFVKCYLLPPRV